ncbi:hypothetical protein N7532_007587 [Penicillium argentinense]|uniref:Uncharacterized protein n=1 Tax=Penicillium argentinense TaxID=1131581 RepID=A0A9W9K7G1_9EURO|nr:uncharacterized protein N7532_007587 [Penicillium argentinense]KAJ5095296.1 hypothetical protein N7532_007587 [Penicillium argentinense]
MWREPGEGDNPKKTLDKDSTAAARSTIRRQPTIRRSSRNRFRARGGGRFLSPAEASLSLDSHIIEDILGTYDQSRRLPHAARTPVLNVGVSEDGLDLDASRRDATSRDSTRADAHRRESSSRRSRTTRDQALTDFLGPIRSEQRPQSAGRPSNSSLTPFFAPAIYHTLNSTLPPADQQLANLNVVFGPPHQESTVDGLGDRQRSPSPDGDRHDAWETLLSTITPDTNLPSTDTSFSSNAAPSGDAARNEPSRNATTSLRSHTLPHFLGPGRSIQVPLDPYPDHLNPCDFDSDEEDTPVNYHGHLRRMPPMPPIRRSSGLHSTMSNHPPVPNFSFSLSDAIVHRMGRHEDIPPEWWAGAGLSRNMGRGLSGGTEANQNDRAE